MTKKLNIATDFSKYPGGRFVDDGPFSGQLFREDFLAPLLVANEKIEINMDGVRGYGSSFLEEAFGGLVRKGFECKTLLSKLVFISKNPSIKMEIEEYIKLAGEKENQAH